MSICYKSDKIKRKKKNWIPFTSIEDILSQLDEKAINIEYGFVHVFLFLKNNKYLILYACSDGSYHLFDNYNMQNLFVLSNYELTSDYGKDYAYIPKEVLINVLGTFEIIGYDFNRRIKNGK